MKKKSRYKFRKPPKAIKKKTALKRITPANRRSSSREYFIKKKTFKTKALAIGIFILIFLGASIYILFFTSIFQIKHIEVKFIDENSLITENEIKNTIYTMLNKKYLYLLSQSNLFLFSKSDLERIIGQDSRVETITLYKKWLPARLLLKITESRPAAQLVIYGDSGEYYLNSDGQVIIPPSENEFFVASLESRGDDNKNFEIVHEQSDENLTTIDERRSTGDFAMLDERRNDVQDFTTINKRRDNLAFTTQAEREKNINDNKESSAPSFKTMVIVDQEEEKDISLPIFYDKTSTNLKEQVIIDLFKNILDFTRVVPRFARQNLTEADIYIPMIEIMEKGGIYEVEMTTTQGWQIFINSEADFNKQLSNLELILKKKIPQKELLQYIDLRFGKKIFYKLK